MTYLYIRIALSGFIFFSPLVQSCSVAQNVIIAVIDGPRYSETFGGDSTCVPQMKLLAAEGTFFPNFRNDSLTVTNPGHAAVLTGTWQPLPNDGTLRPTKPTLFEYFRKELGSTLSLNYVIAGKGKLNILTHGTHSDYGPSYAATFVLGSNDRAVFDSLISVMTNVQPRLILANFPSVDVSAHAGNYSVYLGAIRFVDSLMHELWETIQILPFYKDSTTLFITADHGRHDDAHGGFQHHGDPCEGCRRIFLLALGRGVTTAVVRVDTASQIDIAPTVATLLGFSASLAVGRNLFPDNILTSVELPSNLPDFELKENYPNPFNSATAIEFGVPEPSRVSLIVYNALGQEVGRVFEDRVEPGFHRFYWESRGLPSGVYFLRMKAESEGNALKVFYGVKKLILLK